LTGTGADFAALFRVTRLEVADDYTFLDPMSNSFEYANSLATVTHELPPHTYVAGVSEALRRVVEKVATGDRARRVRERVALELALLARKRKELLTRSGFQAQFDRIAGTKVI
jgi:2-oxo-4-hydroxy-4-carboxy--5-ureidoimidazoline (OHCU) decarboxylase